MMVVRQRAVATLPTLMRALRKEPPKPTTQPLPSLRRAFSLYDQINLIDNVPEDQLRFQGYLFTFSISFLPPISSSFRHYPMWRLKAKAFAVLIFNFLLPISILANWPFLGLGTISEIEFRPTLSDLLAPSPKIKVILAMYTDTGFTVSGVQYEGSLLCVGNVLLSWGPKKLSEITADRCFEDAHHCTFLAYPWLNGNNLCLQIKKLASLGVKKASSKGITNSHVEEMPPWPLKAWLKRQGVVMGIWEVPGSIPNVKKNSYL
ncbi:hypothetical protein CK203_028352 [Vitis vinifera]|uniref:Uncharacterized protein n=1 Tax=Vitis vinifera TaxID=29760 RepID=A0A438J046_VITVI|nr:hypothetical protein CK203_028352 [Vitis vinifera]